ncbi:hypothetical protein [Pseudodesulfovibrio sp.]|uniref:hypothetical protein n=1 Tax=unclassified Pseudodesulfovibrio TaxID=2661612 RepID=UPI003B00EA2F
MRTLIAILIMLMLCTTALAMGSKPDTPPTGDAAAEGAAPASDETAAKSDDGAALATDPAQADKDAAADKKAPAPADAQTTDDSGVPVVETNPQPDPDGPVGELHMTDGNVYEILALPKIGKFYLYLNGKLNGRTSTVISPTRMADVRRWVGISQDGPGQFTVVTRDKKQFQFTDAHLYIGSIKSDIFSFLITDPVSYDNVVKTVKKTDVKVITFK